jgi:hypothetical protein
MVRCHLRPDGRGAGAHGGYRRTRAVAVLAAASLLGACSLVHHYFGRSGDEGPAPKPIVTLSVENQNYYDATVYAVTEAGERQRIGRVTGLTRSTFTFRWLHNDLRVLIQLLADGSAITQPVPVNPGDSLNLVIQPDLNLTIP